MTTISSKISNNFQSFGDILCLNNTYKGIDVIFNQGHRCKGAFRLVLGISQAAMTAFAVYVVYSCISSPSAPGILSDSKKFTEGLENRLKTTKQVRCNFQQIPGINEKGGLVEIVNCWLLG